MTLFALGLITPFCTKPGCYTYAYWIDIYRKHLGQIIKYSFVASFLILYAAPVFAKEVAWTQNYYLPLEFPAIINMYKDISLTIFRRRWSWTCSSPISLHALHMLSRILLGARTDLDRLLRLEVCPLSRWITEQIPGGKILRDWT